MKRSRALALTLMASGSFMLTACDDPAPETAAEYDSYDSCVAAGVYTGTYCETALGLTPTAPVTEPVYTSLADCVAAPGTTQEQCEAALKAAQADLPKFTSQAACEEALGSGACQVVVQNGSSSWTPFLAGYMVSRMIGDLTDSRYGRPVYRSSDGRWSSGPSYRTPPSGTARASTSRSGTVDAKPWSSSGSKDTAKAAPPPKSSKTTVVSRSGFGGGGGWGG